jgi:hypothetical protein
VFIPIPSLDSLSIRVVIASDYHKEISDFAFTGLSTNRERFQSTEYHRSFTDHANEQHGTPQSMFLFTNGILSLTHIRPGTSSFSFQEKKRIPTE